jgi:HEAT repeat protein
MYIVEARIMPHWVVGFPSSPNSRKSQKYASLDSMLSHTDPRAVACLITLSADPEAGVRDWATFGLGVQIDIDTPEIRAALRARLYDPDGDTVGEAIVGLARRKDAHVVAPLLEVLQAGNVGSLVLEAAAALADPLLLPTLQQIQSQWGGNKDWPYQLLEEAIAACTPRTNAEN